MSAPWGRLPKASSNRCTAERVTAHVHRRQFLKLAAGVSGLAGAGALGCAVVAREDPALWYKVAHAVGLPQGPDKHFPSSGARLVEGSFPSRYMKGAVGWCYSVPANAAPQAIVVCLYGKGADQHSVFDVLHLPDAAVYVGAPLAFASAYGGSDNYWHRRANGTDAHAMLVQEFVPLLRQRLGAQLPLALYGFSMGGYGALLAAERAEGAGGDNLFRAAAVSSPALWTGYGSTAPGAFDDAADFAANDVFNAVGDLRSLAVRLDCGDFDPFYGTTRHLSAEMTWPHTAVWTAGGGHTSGYWRSVAPAQMRFLAQACGVVNR